MEELKTQIEKILNHPFDDDVKPIIIITTDDIEIINSFSVWDFDVEKLKAIINYSDILFSARSNNLHIKFILKNERKN